MKTHILAVIGAQYGSEGKGVIVNHLADRYLVHVRTGGPNAGHSFVHQNKKWTMQVVPCGWTNPNAHLVIGRGMLIDLDILKSEIEAVNAVGGDLQGRLFIDPKAGILEPVHADEERVTNGVERIGSTAKGVGVARVARIRRGGESFRFAEEIEWLHPYLQNTPEFLNRAYCSDRSILLEGTQGSALSLIHGPWPYVTSHDTNAAQLAADAGIPPARVTKTLIVARTYPIRVAGNSGPLKGEISWDDISARMGRPITEQTTVTKKTRRIGEWDEDLLDRAITLNAPTSLAITFMDYMFPKDEGRNRSVELTSESQAFLRYLRTRFQTRVSLVGTGGNGWQVIDTGEAL